MEVGRGGDTAYILLREALVKTGKIAIAKVVIKTRQHLAAVKAQEKGLMLGLMHFPEELLPMSEFKEPIARTIGKRELDTAVQLVDSMTSPWKPEKYTDEYRHELEELIQDKIEHGDKAVPRTAAKKQPSKIINLVSVLKKSIEETEGHSKAARQKAARQKAGKGKHKTGAASRRSRKKAA